MKGIKEVTIRLIEERKLWSDRQINTPLDAVELLVKELSQYDREVVMVLNLNAKNRIINMNVVAMGSVNSCIAYPREIFKSSILSNATSILLIHNHPSGDCKISEDDIKVTYRIKECGDLIGIYLLDHIVTGYGNDKSIKKETDILLDK